MMSVSGPYRFTFWREPDPDRRCNNPHPAFPATTCNRTAGHDGDHRYTSPADNRSIAWSDEMELPL